MDLQKFGETEDGRTVHEIVLTLPSGVRASVITFGAILRDLQMPRSDGSLQRVVLGFKDLAGYVADRSFIGATVGRNANRIAGGRFHLDGVDYRLACNDGGGRNHLHGACRVASFHGGVEGLQRGRHVVLARRWCRTSGKQHTERDAHTSPDDWAEHGAVYHRQRC